MSWPIIARSTKIRNVFAHKRQNPLCLFDLTPRGRSKRRRPCLGILRRLGVVPHSPDPCALPGAACYRKDSNSSPKTAIPIRDTTTIHTIAVCSFGDPPSKEKVPPHFGQGFVLAFSSRRVVRHPHTVQRSGIPALGGICDTLSHAERPPVT